MMYVYAAYSISHHLLHHMALKTKDTYLYETVQYVDAVWSSNTCGIRPFQNIGLLKTLQDCEE